MEATNVKKLIDHYRGIIETEKYPKCLYYMGKVDALQVVYDVLKEEEDGRK